MTRACCYIRVAGELRSVDNLSNHPGRKLQVTASIGSVSKRPRSILLGLAVLLVLAACGGPSSASPSTAAQSTAPSSESASTQAAPSATPVASASQSAAAGLTGTWTGTWKRTSPAVAGQGDLTLTLQQQGDAITGTVTETGSACFVSAPVTGTVNGSSVTFKISESTVTATYNSTLSGSTLTGTYSITCAAGVGTADWNASRS